MNKALWSIAGLLLVIAILQGMLYSLERSYLLEQIPVCEPIDERGVSV